MIIVEILLLFISLEYFEPSSPFVSKSNLDWCARLNISPFINFFRDVGLILQFTDVWQGKSIEDVSVEEYTGLMNSHVINLNATLANETFIGENSLKNCSLVEYLNDAASGTGLAFIGESYPFSYLFTLVRRT